MTNFRFPLSSFPVREGSSHKSQLITEILYGQRLIVLEQSGTWKKIRILRDNYEGWIEFNHSFMPDCESLFVAKRKNELLSQFGEIEVFPGAELHPQEKLKLSQPNSNVELISLAKSYLNVPYLWGGKTYHGVDCSGFMQVLFATQYINLPRDAYQQAELGELVSFDTATAGDLAFFKNDKDRITHVGLILRENEIIHASEMVRIDSLTKTGIWNGALQKETHQLSYIKRLAELQLS